MEIYLDLDGVVVDFMRSVILLALNQGIVAGRAAYKDEDYVKLFLESWPTGLAFLDGFHIPADPVGGALMRKESGFGRT